MVKTVRRRPLLGCAQLADIIIIVVLIICAEWVTLTLQQKQKWPENVCPLRFAYSGSKPGQYHAVINVNKEVLVEAFKLQVTFSMLGEYQDVELRLKLKTDRERIINSKNLLFRVDFPRQDVLPKVIEIVFNDEVVCYGAQEIPGIPRTYLTAQLKFPPQTETIGRSPARATTLATIMAQPTIMARHPAEESQDDQSSFQCGIVLYTQQLVVNGDPVTENEFPWLVAMMKANGPGYGFHCTANLISSRHVLTAAHCCDLKHRESYLLLLGQTDITKWAINNEISQRAIQRIHIHPDYKPKTGGHGDLAILLMYEKVRFSSNLRPICLANYDQLEGVGVGKVAGWGKVNETIQSVSEAKKVDLPIVDEAKCLRSEDGFNKLTSEKTFCAGNRDRRGPCTGDSGGGFVVDFGNRWYLRGIVSLAVRTNQAIQCDLEHYVIFVDISKYFEWLQGEINKK